MKSRSKLYAKGVIWIAEYDETAETSVKIMSELISVLLLADLFELKPEDVATDIIVWRWGT